MAVPGIMRCSTRSAGNLNTPISSAPRMTRLVTLSRARPRKPLTSPGAVQRRRRELAGAGVGGGGTGESSRLLADTPGKGGAPGERAAVVGHVLVVEVDHIGRAAVEGQLHAI